jgi:uncharacterized membrane protein
MSSSSTKKNPSLVMRQRTSRSTMLSARSPLKDDATSTTPSSSSLKAEEPPPRPDPSVLIASMDDGKQRLAIGAIVVSLAVGTGLVVAFLELLHNVILPTGWFELWRDYTWPIPMGLVFLAAGSAHFTIKDTFTAMVPPLGTWGGLWQVPAPGAAQIGLSYAEYHTYWSGVAEITGGALLILAGIGLVPVPIPAFGLLLLTASVTPANIYMATHDIQPARLPPVPYPGGHLARGVLQCVLLAIFWELTFQ